MYSVNNKPNMTEKIKDNLRHRQAYLIPFAEHNRNVECRIDGHPFFLSGVEKSYVQLCE